MTTHLLTTSSECTTKALSSRYLRSIYYLHTATDAEAFLTANKEWIGTLTSKLETTRSDVSATTVRDPKVKASGKAVNVWFSVRWANYDDGVWLVDMFSTRCIRSGSSF